MNQERDYFLFRKEWCDAVSGLPPKLRHEILDAIILYGIYGESREGLGSVSGLTFSIVKAVIDRDNEELARRESVSSVKSACGKMGGRPKRNSERSIEDNSEKSTAKSNEKAELFERKNLESPASLRACVVEDNNKNISIDKKEDNQKKKKETSKKETENLPREKALEILDYFNKLVKDNDSKIPKCLKLSEQRHSHLRMRHAEYGIKTLYEAIDKLFKSDFLSGKSNQWRASFDWLICPTNFLKVIEGNYDNIQQKYGNNNNEKPPIDPRRGTDAGQYAADEY